jgi:hypothetical protein
MATTFQYRARKAHGVCPLCGESRDQMPYALCRACYTPHPTPRLPLGVPPGDRRAWRTAYRFYQLQRHHAPVELGCCGVFHAVTTVPFPAPCCGRVWFVSPEEDRP